MPTIYAASQARKAYKGDDLWDNALLYELFKGRCIHKSYSALAWREGQWPKISCICFTTPSGMSCRQTRQPLKLMQKRVQFQTAAAGMGNKRYARSVASSLILKRPVSGIIRWVVTTGETIEGCQPLQSAAHMPTCPACTFNGVPIYIHL